MRCLALLLIVGCAHARDPVGGTADASDTGHHDDAANVVDSSSSGGSDGPSSGGDAALGDAAGSHDAPLGIITGGPCISGAQGATAYRVKFADAGGHAQVVYEVNGLPDHSRDHTGVFGYQIGFQSSFVDPFLGVGGLQLDSSDFVDIELTTAGVSQISKATLSLFGRSYNTTASGSFNWQTFDGTGSTPTSSVSNVAPYHWDHGDMTTEISPGDNGVLIRIKAGPASGALVVNRIELCLVAS